MSKLVSSAVEWIGLSFDTTYYTELPPYSSKTEIATGHMSYLPVVAPLLVTDIILNIKSQEHLIFTLGDFIW